MPSTRRNKRQDFSESDLKNLRHFKKLTGLLQRLHSVAAARDKSGNRELYYDNYVCLLLLAYFNPIITSLRALEQASKMGKVQKRLSFNGTSLASLSECAGLFDSALLREIVQEVAVKVAAKARQNKKIDGISQREVEALQGLTAVDGTLLKALPRMEWSLCCPGHNAVKMHLQFSVLTGAPSDALITKGSGSEINALKENLLPGRMYVMDRGYISFPLFSKIIAAKSSLIARIHEDVAFEVQEERDLSKDAREAGVIHDYILSRVGTDHRKNHFKHPMRLVIVEFEKQDQSKTKLYLLTDRLDIDAQTVALGYRFRWSIELYFRWLKCTVGCRHLFSENLNGISIQCYSALIAGLMVSLWTGLKLNKRTWEMVQLYILGWATLTEVEDHIHKRRLQEEKKAIKKQPEKPWYFAAP